MEDAQTVDESGAVEQPAASLSAGPLEGESRENRRECWAHSVQSDFENNNYVSP